MEQKGSFATGNVAFVPLSAYQLYMRYTDREDFEIIGLSLENDRGALGDFVATHGVLWTNIYEDRPRPAAGKAICC